MSVRIVFPNIVAILFNRFMGASFSSQISKSWWRPDSSSLMKTEAVICMALTSSSPSLIHSLETGTTFGVILIKALESAPQTIILFDSFHRILLNLYFSPLLPISYFQLIYLCLLQPSFLASCVTIAIICGSASIAAFPLQYAHVFRKISSADMTTFGLITTSA